MSLEKVVQVDAKTGKRTERMVEMTLPIDPPRPRFLDASRLVSVLKTKGIIVNDNEIMEEL